MAANEIGGSGNTSRRSAPYVLQRAVIAICALVAVCGLALAGPASAAPLSPAAKPAPTLTLTASSTLVRIGEAPVLTVRLTSDATGDIGFYDEARPGADKGIGLAPILGGVATLAAPDRPLVLGDNPIRASYGGSPIYAPADSNAVTVVVVSKPAPSMTLTASSTNVRTTEAPPVLTVRMPADVTGEVGFYDAARPGADKGIGLAPIIAGVATLTAPDRPLVLGDNPIRTSYGGNATYAPADSNAVTVVLSKLTPRLTLTASSMLVHIALPPVLTVRMPAGVTGEVGFYDAARPGADKGIGLAPIIDGVATLTAPDRPLVLGDNPIGASYGGNAIYAPADSNAVTVVAVSALAPMLMLTASSTVALELHPPVLTVQMAARATGVVTFLLYDYTRRWVVLGEAPNIGGVATFTPSTRSVAVLGSFPVYASYHGNLLYAGARSNEVTLTVIRPSQTVAFTGSQQTVTSPSGATSVRITAIGGSGAVAPPCGAHTVVGGFGAMVTGTVAITAGTHLVVDVGGAAESRTGGWGGAAGGGNGGHRPGLYAGTGGGGGGATTVQLSLSGVPTLIIAGGGGGGGDCGQAFGIGGNGGSAGVTAGNGQNGSGGISPGGGGAGGGATTPAGEAGSGAGGGGGGGAAGGLGGTGSSSGAAGGGGGGGSSVASSKLTGAMIATARTTGNGTLTLQWLSR